MASACFMDSSATRAIIVWVLALIFFCSAFVWSKKQLCFSQGSLQTLTGHDTWVSVNPQRGRGFEELSLGVGGKGTGQESLGLTGDGLNKKAKQNLKKKGQIILRD